jgi:hypothetical protein
MPAIKISRTASRVLLGGLIALVIVVAIVLWPRSTPGGEPSTALAAHPIPPVPGLPPGAAACESVYTDLGTSYNTYNAGARGTPMTSCMFVEEVRRAYAATKSPPDQTLHIDVVSPATRKRYIVACFRATGYITCTGGQGAIVYLYHRGP